MHPIHVNSAARAPFPWAVDGRSPSLSHIAGYVGLLTVRPSSTQPQQPVHSCRCCKFQGYLYLLQLQPQLANQQSSQPRNKTILVKNSNSYNPQPHLQKDSNSYNPQPQLQRLSISWPTSRAASRITPSASSRYSRLGPTAGSTTATTHSCSCSGYSSTGDTAAVETAAATDPVG
jgi:hypothetical protein